MRMRRKPNLAPRMERVSHFFVNEPEALRGNWKSAFGGYRAVYVELGCGKGKFTVETANLSPDALTVGIERVPDAVVVAAERATDTRTSNVRFVSGDATKLAEMFAPGEISCVFINFCDPWSKSRYAKRRLTSPDFLRLYREILAPDGEIRFKTDNIALFDYSLGTFAENGWVVGNVTYDLHKDGAVGVLTDYESKFVAQGVKICGCTASFQ